jgi:hypothetical protein
MSSSWSSTRAVRRLTGSSNRVHKKEKDSGKEKEKTSPRLRHTVSSHANSSTTPSQGNRQASMPASDGSETTPSTQLQGRRSNTEARPLDKKPKSHFHTHTPRTVQPTRARERGLSKSRSLPKIRRDVRQSVMRDQYGFALEDNTNKSGAAADATTTPTLSRSPAQHPHGKEHKLLVKQERKWEVCFLVVVPVVPVVPVVKERERESVC